MRLIKKLLIRQARAGLSACPCPYGGVVCVGVAQTGLAAASKGRRRGSVCGGGVREGKECETNACPLNSPSPHHQDKRLWQTSGAMFVCVKWWGVVSGCSPLGREVDRRAHWCAEFSFPSGDGLLALGKRRPRTPPFLIRHSLDRTLHYTSTHPSLTQPSLSSPPTYTQAGPRGRDAQANCKTRPGSLPPSFTSPQRHCRRRRPSLRGKSDHTTSHDDHPASRPHHVQLYLATLYSAGGTALLTPRARASSFLRVPRSIRAGERRAYFSRGQRRGLHHRSGTLRRSTWMWATTGGRAGRRRLGGGPSRPCTRTAAAKREEGGQCSSGRESESSRSREIKANTLKSTIRQKWKMVDARIETSRLGSASGSRRRCDKRLQRPVEERGKSAGQCQGKEESKGDRVCLPFQI